MNNLTSAPALKFLFIATLGFLSRKLCIMTAEVTYIFIGILLIFSIIMLFADKKFLTVFFILFSFGMFTAQRTQNLDFSYNGDFPPQINGLFNGKVLEELKHKGKTSRYIVEGSILTADFHQIENTKLHFTLINSRKQQVLLKKGNRIYSLIKFRLPNSSNLPGEFSEKSYYRSLEVDFTAYSFVQDLSVTDTTALRSINEKIALNISKKIDTLFSINTSSIIKAIILGDQSKIPQEIRQNFSLSGTAHILSVSGLHVGIIAIIIFWFFSFIKNSWIKFFIFSLTLWSYIFLVDMQPAAVRAALMIMIFLLSKVVQRKANPINVISVTVLIIAAVNPGTIYSAGFQMSIASIAGVILLYKPINNFFKNLLGFKKDSFIQKSISNSLSMTLSATIVVSPIVAFYFNTFSIISPITNFVSIPIMVFGQIYSIIAVVTSFVFFPVAKIFATTAQLTIELTEIITYYAANIPGAYFTGENLSVLSIFISITLLLFFTSKSFKQLLFRTIYSIAAILILIFISETNTDQQSYLLYNRPTSEYFEFDKLRFSILTEKPIQTGRGYDYGLFSYFSKFEKEWKIYYSGNTGILLKEKINNPRVKMIRINESSMNHLIKKIKSPN